MDDKLASWAERYPKAAEELTAGNAAVIPLRDPRTSLRVAYSVAYRERGVRTRRYSMTVAACRLDK